MIRLSTKTYLLALLSVAIYFGPSGTCFAHDSGDGGSGGTGGTAGSAGQIYAGSARVDIVEGEAEPTPPPADQGDGTGEAP